MSRAGKFIPGGSRTKTSGLNNAAGSGRTGPIRAPDGAPGDPPPANKRSFVKGSSLVKPVAKSQRLPIVVMSAAVCCLLVSVAWYNFAVLPAKRDAEAARLQAEATKKQLTDLQAQQQKEQEELKKKQDVAVATLIVDARPAGASVTVGDEHKIVPATFDDLKPGKVSVAVTADGYEPFQQDAVLTAEKSTDLGVIQLVRMVGSLSLTSPQNGVTYTLTSSNGYSRNGQVPDKIEALPIGDYQLLAAQKDWKLAPVTFSVRNKENVEREIKFPYANLTITSVPPGATVRNGRTVLGQTPLTLPPQHPGTLNLSIDQTPFVSQKFTVELDDFANVTKQITLHQDKNFVAASGIPMVWLPDGYWAGKYLVRQADFETVAGFNPSTYRRPNRPVETISWEGVSEFLDKLNQYEKKAGKLPAGYHYTVPTESQWATLAADADIDLSAMSRTDTLPSTQDVGYSEPNKYGIFDSLGNVWEWCFDADPQGNHSLRGGSWLSSPVNFPNADTRSAAAPKYADRFTGFRVVLVPN